MRRDYTKAYKKKMVEKYKKSNIRISGFCQENNIPLSTFNRWLSENAKAGKDTTDFGEVDVQLLDKVEAKTTNQTSKPEGSDEIKLISPNIEVIFKSGCSKKILQPLLEAILID